MLGNYAINTLNVDYAGFEKFNEMPMRDKLVIIEQMERQMMSSLKTALDYWANTIKGYNSNAGMRTIELGIAITYGGTMAIMTGGGVMMQALTKIGQLGAGAAASAAAIGSAAINRLAALGRGAIAKIMATRCSNDVWSYTEKARRTLGADGGRSKHIFEKLNGKTNSVIHHVTDKFGNIITHQHQTHVGKYGSHRQFPNSWVNFPQIK